MATNRVGEALPAKAKSWAAFGALGVVFGDLGTSPLYTLQTVVQAMGGHFTPQTALGVLSLVFWTLIVTISIKYCLFVMRADNRGEGGILALMSLIGANGFTPGVRLLTGMGLLGAALIYGDGVITPAISVLSALEGVNVVTEIFKPYVMPMAVVILLVLFAAQRFGTEKIGRAFGPVMLLWFMVIALLGVASILKHPDVIAAVDPRYAIRFMATSGRAGFLVLGGVFLCITGGEALYADMGHFGRRPISRAWMVVVLPALLLCYAGQAALVLGDPAAIEQAFFLLAPHWALWPLLALATAATVIASQSAITGAFSITQQAIQLGYLPRLTIVHTSEAERGQVFAPAVNALLCVAVIGLVLGFRSSTALAAAFGFAVTSTMVLTTLIMGFVIFRIWRRRTVWAVLLYAILLAFDAVLFGASATKIPDGAWLPLVIAALLMVLFTTWARGRTLLAARLAQEAMPVEDFLRATATIQRVPGLAVYFTRDEAGVPTALLHSLKHHHVLHERVVLLTIRTALLPHMDSEQRLRLEELATGMGRVVLTFGFLDEPDVPEALKLLPPAWREEPMRTSYVLGRQILIHAARPGMSRWREALFSALVRVSSSAMEYYRLPPGRVVELGSQVEI
jgi:KUP system potassium uptake protein